MAVKKHPVNLVDFEDLRIVLRLTIAEIADQVVFGKGRMLAIWCCRP